jgi:hypothetical protein
LTHDWQTFPVKGQIVNILDLAEASNQGAKNEKVMGTYKRKINFPTFLLMKLKLY